MEKGRIMANYDDSRVTLTIRDRLHFNAIIAAQAILVSRRNKHRRAFRAI